MRLLKRALALLKKRARGDSIRPRTASSPTDPSDGPLRLQRLQGWRITAPTPEQDREALESLLEFCGFVKPTSRAKRPFALGPPLSTDRVPLNAIGAYFYLGHAQYKLQARLWPVCT